LDFGFALKSIYHFNLFNKSCVAFVAYEWKNTEMEMEIDIFQYFSLCF